VTAERHAEVVGFCDFENSQHPLAGDGLSRGGNFFRERVEAGRAGNEEKTETRFASKPPRPRDRAQVHGRFETVLCEGICNDAIEIFHGHLGNAGLRCQVLGLRETQNPQILL